MSLPLALTPPLAAALAASLLPGARAVPTDCGSGCYERPGSDALSAGATAGIVVGVVLFAIVACSLLVWAVYRRRARAGPGAGTGARGAGPDSDSDFNSTRRVSYASFASFEALDGRTGPGPGLETEKDLPVLPLALPGEATVVLVGNAPHPGAPPPRRSMGDRI